MRSFSRPGGSATQRAYAFAKWAILTAVYEGGDVISEGALARELGVSRTPVREALLRLDAEGLVRLRTGRGAVVTSFSLAEAEDVLEARVLVENFTAAKSFASRGEFLPELERVHALMQRRCRERNTAAFTEADRVFHETIVDAAGNVVLSEVYRTLRERQTLFTSVLVRGRADRMQSAIDEHERILDRLRGDDASAFVDVVNQHLQWSTALARESARESRAAAESSA